MKKYTVGGGVCNNPLKRQSRFIGTKPAPD